MQKGSKGATNFNGWAEEAKGTSRSGLTLSSRAALPARIGEKCHPLFVVLQRNPHRVDSSAERSKLLTETFHHFNQFLQAVVFSAWSSATIPESTSDEQLTLLVALLDTRNPRSVPCKTGRDSRRRTSAFSFGLERLAMAQGRRTGTRQEYCLYKVWCVAKDHLGTR